jgi:hypothetical protein
MTTAAGAAGRATVQHEPGMGMVEVFPLPVDEATLFAVLRDAFSGHWREIRFGVLIQGSVFEIRATAAPRLGLRDGYVTVDLGDSHFHVCIGPHSGEPGRPVDPELARHRRCHRAELYRVLHDGAPVSWGLRLYNGAGEQQLTILLPNPFLDDEQRVRAEPDWSRLTCWDELRARYLGLPAQPLDRAAPRFHHG